MSAYCDAVLCARGRWIVAGKPGLAALCRKYSFGTHLCLQHSQVEDLALRADVAINDILYWRESRKMHRALVMTAAVGSAVGLLLGALSPRRRDHREPVQAEAVRYV